MTPEPTDLKNLGGPPEQVAIEHLSRIKAGMFQVGSGLPVNNMRGRGEFIEHTLCAREGAIEVGSAWVASVIPLRLLAEETEYVILSIYVADGKGKVLVRAQKWQDDQLTEETQDWHLNGQLAAPKCGLGGKLVIGPAKGRKCTLSLWVRPPLLRAAELSLKYPGCKMIAQRLFGFRNVKNATVACKGGLMTTFVMPETLHTVRMYTAEQWRERTKPKGKSVSEKIKEEEKNETDDGTRGVDEERKEMDEDDGILNITLSPNTYQHSEYSETEGKLFLLTTEDGKHKRVELYPPSEEEYVLVGTTEQGDLLEASEVSIRYYNR
jgi:hypothetical protein